ncbi:MAG: AI-2E family transporter [Armatimonadetes bacterium]|nr:AI-2E family transporter [Armatimonadota bacterium]MBM3946762.1 AI-2E family transporter [SAR202 cluster bacterium]
MPPLPLTYRDLQRAIFLGAGLFVLWHLAEPLTTLLLFFLLVFILSAALNPAVARLERRGLPRVGSAVGIALLFLLLLCLLGVLVFPPLVDEVGKFVSGLDARKGALQEYYQNLLQRYPRLAAQLPDPGEAMKNLTPTLGRLVGQVGRYTANLVVGVASLFLLLVLVIYTVAHPAPLVAGLLGAAPEEYRDRAERALRRSLIQLQNWAFGSLLLGLIVGVMTALGLWLLGLATGRPFPYLLLFSLIAGIGELIPNLGPILSAVPPALIAFSLDPLLGLWVVLLFILIQQLENNLIVPMVMGQSLNLHPLSVTFMVLVMGSLFGLLGAILAVPVCAILKVCWEEFYLIPSGVNVEELQEAAERIVGAGPRPTTPRSAVRSGSVWDPEALPELDLPPADQSPGLARGNPGPMELDVVPAAMAEPETDRNSSGETNRDRPDPPASG